MELQILLTQASDGLKLNLTDGEILRVLTDTLGSDVLYYKHGERRQITVTESPAKIAGLTKTLIKVTDDDSINQWINAEKIILIDSRNDGEAGSQMKYDIEGAYPKIINITQTKGAINKSISEAAGNTSYTIAGINITNKTFSLASGDGDKTSTFTAGKFFSVVDSTGNDGSYEVASSTFSGGGQTVITVKETISNATADGSVLIVTTQ